MPEIRSPSKSSQDRTEKVNKEVPKTTNTLPQIEPNITPGKPQQSPEPQVKPLQPTVTPAAIEPEPEAAVETPPETIEPVEQVVEKKREIKIPLALRRLFSSSNKSS